MRRKKKNKHRPQCNSATLLQPKSIIDGFLAYKFRWMNLKSQGFDGAVVDESDPCLSVHLIL